MSYKFKQRLQHRLPIVFRDFMGMSHEDRLEIDAIVAAMTGMSCDQAAERLTDSEFDQIAQDAIRRFKRKKKGLATAQATVEEEIPAGVA